MYRFRIHYITIIIFLISLSCNRHDEIVKDIYNRWEITDFMSVESVLYEKDNNFDPVIEFYRNGSYSIQLDVNNCLGGFSLPGNEEVNITVRGCTKMCCDSDFSKKIIEMLPQVDSYSIEKNKMKLNVPGWGWINLELDN